MSLKDALLRAGAATKQQAREAERAQREARNREKGNQKKRAVLEAEARAAEAARVEAARAEALARRQAAEAARAEEARVHRARQLIAHHGLGSIPHGPARFTHPALDGPGLRRLSLPWSLARALREGRAAVAALTHAWSDEVDYRVLPGEVAARVHGVAPELLVFYNARPPEDPSEARLLDEDCPATPWDGAAPWRWSDPEARRRWGPGAP